MEQFLIEHKDFLLEHSYWLYVFLFIGTFLEGETMVIIAGYFAATYGYLSLPMIILSSFTGTMCGDQLAFYIGRFFGPRLVDRWSEKARARVAKVTGMLNRYDIWFILSFRFIYGVRNVAPFAIGMSAITNMRFFVLNFIAAAVWAIAFGCIGYFFGQVVQQFFDEIKHYVLLGLVAVVILVWIIHKLRQKKPAPVGSI
ncbi:MAG: DedA family protein [Magnetococcales bacterium]|nr:DedA family protein [Magnetococcales bacterium]